MRADRLLSILLLLQVHQRLTARELATRLEVSERTIYRDMEALTLAGIPVVAERGKGGGWFLLEAYQTNLTGLSPIEIQALFLPKPSHLLADLGLHQASEAAFIKLLAALPAMYRRDAESIRQRIHVDATGWRSCEEDISSFPTLFGAIWQECKLHLVYQRSDRTTVERLVDPLGLVAKGSVWYLVAGIEGDVRSYRVSRIRDAKVTEQPCVYPQGFNLAEYWERSSAQFQANLPHYPVMVRIAPAILPRLRYAGRFAKIEQVEQPDTDGWSKVCIQFDVEEAACEYVLSFGSQIEVLQPQELREKIVQLAKSVVEFYAQQ